MLGDLVAARLAMIVAISAWRVRRYPENAAYIQAWDEDSWRLLELFDQLGADAVALELGAPRPLVATRCARVASGAGARSRPDAAVVLASRSTSRAAKACGSTTPTATGCWTRTTTCPSSGTAIRA